MRLIAFILTLLIALPCYAGVEFSGCSLSGVVVGGEYDSGVSVGYFGSKSIADNNNLNADTAEAWKFYLDKTATITEIGLMIFGTASDTNIVLAIYSADGATKYAEVAEKTVTSGTSGEVSYSVVSEIEIPSGYYYLYANADSVGISIQNNTGVATDRVTYSEAYTGSAPATINVTGEASNNYPRSLFAGYEY